MASYSELRTTVEFEITVIVWIVFSNQSELRNVITSARPERTAAITYHRAQVLTELN
jgi:hypothetical protein